jgi:hypothetical protein
MRGHLRREEVEHGERPVVANIRETNISKGALICRTGDIGRVG